MIYQALCVLALFAGVSANSKIEAAKVNEVVAKVRSQVSNPTSLSAKLDKARKVPATHVRHKDASHMKFDESHTEGHLRSLRLRDNFVEVRAYTDATCSTLKYRFGELVNYCYNEKNEYHKKRSYLYKINKKDHTYVELEYEGKDCQGVPIRVTDLIQTYFPSFEDYGVCTWNEQEGEYNMVNYLSTYPTEQYIPGFLSERTYPEDMCNVKENKNFIEYSDTDFSEYGLTGCVPSGSDTSFMLDTSTCSTDHYATVYIYYPTTTCSGSPVYSASVFEASCDQDYDDDFDDDDDDDFDDDDDDYELVNVIETEYCA